MSLHTTKNQRSLSTVSEHVRAGRSVDILNTFILAYYISNICILIERPIPTSYCPLQSPQLTRCLIMISLVCTSLEGRQVNQVMKNQSVEKSQPASSSSPELTDRVIWPLLLIMMMKLVRNIEQVNSRSSWPSRWTRFHCGGSIVNPKCVRTAMHCRFNMRIKDAFYPMDSIQAILRRIMFDLKGAWTSIW